MPKPAELHLHLNLHPRHAGPKTSISAGVTFT